MARKNDGLLVPIAIVLSGLVYFAAKTQVQPAWYIVRWLFGFSETPYQHGNAWRIGYGTPAGDRESITREQAEKEAKAVLKQAAEEAKTMAAGVKLPWFTERMIILFTYFALPYPDDGTVKNNIAIIIDTGIQAAVDGPNSSDYFALDEAYNAVFEVLTPDERALFDAIYEFALSRRIPSPPAE